LDAVRIVARYALSAGRLAPEKVIARGHQRMVTTAAQMPNALVMPTYPRHDLTYEHGSSLRSVGICSHAFIGSDFSKSHRAARNSTLALGRTINGGQKWWYRRLADDGVAPRVPYSAATAAPIVRAIFSSPLKLQRFRIAIHNQIMLAKTF
jgi:hypothetical protein